MTLTDDTARGGDTVRWDLEPLLAGESPDVLLDRASLVAEELMGHRGHLADLDAGGLSAFMHQLAELHDLLGRAGSYTGLAFAADTNDARVAAAMQAVQERATQITTPLVFIELEWNAVPDEVADELLADERLTFCAHWLASARRFRPHQLSEPEERLDAEHQVVGRNAWTRLFGELTSALECQLDGPDGSSTVGLDSALALLFSPDREQRRAAQRSVTEALAPGLKTRGFIYNIVMLDRSIDDRLRHFDTWISSWNLSNHASDASVKALVAAVRARYDLPQRWYSLKSRVLGYPLADYDRYGAIADSTAQVAYGDATGLVLEAYRAFSPEMARMAGEFLENRWVDVNPRPGKQPGAFCSYTVPSHHPYLFLNWTSRPNDVLTLAHEMGHGLHGYLARPQGVFHQMTPLTVAETASVFGETLTFERLLGQTSDPADRLSLLANQVEGAIATVFRQTAMNCFEEAAHTARRREGELSTDRLGELWVQTQHEMLGDSVEITPEYASWWSYIPHFINTPGYVYAYAFGQLLALSVYDRYRHEGPSFVPRYLEMLASGGSRSPEELAAMVGCDLSDPAFWDGGLALVSEQLDAAEVAARAAGRIS